MIQQIIQAILFASPYPIEEEEIFRVISKEHTDVTAEIVSKALLDLRAEFQRDFYAMDLQKSAMGYSLVTKPHFYPYVVDYIETIQRKRLSKSALETLSIIAFKPDSTKVDIELIRGVAADYAIERLMERELIVISGRKNAPGHPVMYRVSDKFYDYFGMETMDELPRPDSIINEPYSEIGKLEEGLPETKQDEAVGDENTPM